MFTLKKKTLIEKGKGIKLTCKLTCSFAGSGILNQLDDLMELRIIPFKLKYPYAEINIEVKA